MRATRRLDILAIVGALLAVFLIIGGVQVYQVICGVPTVEDRDKARSVIMGHIPDSDVRADFAIMTSDSDILCPKAYKHRMQIVNDAAREFGSSARIQFRAGMTMEGIQSVKALQKASELDTTNSLPLYLLASEAASHQSVDKAVSLLRKGNQRTRFTDYPLPTIDFSTGVSRESAALFETVSKPGVTIVNNGHTSLTTLAHTLCDHAMRLQNDGKTDEALQLLGDIKKMARAQLHKEGADVIGIITGTRLLNIALASEQKILKATGSQSKQATKEMQEVQYLKAGTGMFANEMMLKLLHYTQEFYAPLVSLGALVLEVWLSLVVLAIFAYLARKSGGQIASESHLGATEKVFSMGRLVKLYALVFIPLGIIASLMFFFVAIWENGIIEIPVLAVLAIVPSLLLHWLSARVYRRAYVDTGSSDITKPWKNAPTSEKREAARRLSGVHGGAIVFLVIWGLLISGGMKLYFGAYPWQPNCLIPNYHTYETTYVQDLLAGKIKLSEKTINDNNPQPK